MTDFANLVDAFAAAIQQKHPLRPHDRAGVVVKYGNKFDRIYLNDSIYAFVDKETGELVKPAGRSQPARNRDGDTFGKYFLNTPDGFATALFNADRYGSFLYQDYPIQQVA